MEFPRLCAPALLGTIFPPESSMFCECSNQEKTPQEKYPLTFLLNEASLCMSGIEWLFVSMPPCAALTKNCVEFFRSESLLVYRGKFSSTSPVDSLEPSHFG